MKRRTYMKWKRRVKKTFKVLFTSFIVLLTIALMAPVALSYLSSTADKGIAIRAAPASEIWEMQGSFDLNRWKATDASGIIIHNKKQRDLWVYYEYTGQLKQIFKNSDPLMVAAGNTGEIALAPIDDEDSLRLLNPLDLIENYKEAGGKKCGCSLNWKTFSGTVKVHTLNDYAVLETTPINISGEVLWKLLFARKYGLDAGQYYQDCWKSQTVSGMDACQTLAASADSKTAAASGSGLKSAGTPRVDIQESTRLLLKQSQTTLDEASAYEPPTFLDPVLQVIEQIAPGFWEDRLQLLDLFNSLKEQLGEMRALLVQYQEKVFTLESEIEDLKIENESLNERIDSLQENLSRRNEPAADSPEAVTIESPAAESAASQSESEAPASGTVSGTAEQPAADSSDQGGSNSEPFTAASDTAAQGSSAAGNDSSSSSSPADEATQ